MCTQLLDRSFAIPLLKSWQLFIARGVSSRVQDDSLRISLITSAGSSLCSTMLIHYIAHDLHVVIRLICGRF